MEEFEKASIVVKTVNVDANNKNKEDMSFLILNLKINKGRMGKF